MPIEDCIQDGTSNQYDDDLGFAMSRRTAPTAIAPAEREISLHFAHPHPVTTIADSNSCRARRSFRPVDPNASAEAVTPLHHVRLDGLDRLPTIPRPHHISGIPILSTSLDPPAG